LAYAVGGKLELENQGDFDEFVLGDWFHVENMDDDVWWLRIGDARVLVTLSKDQPPTVDVERGFYGEPRGTTKS
jgi:hypothetical protein